MKARKKKEKLIARQIDWERMMERNRGSSIVNQYSFKKPGSVNK